MEVAPSLVRYATRRAAKAGLIDRLRYLVGDMRDLTASPTQSLRHVARPKLGDVGSARPDAGPPSGARTQLANGRLTEQTQAKQNY